jgi:hypothetical protein
MTQKRREVLTARTSSDIDILAVGVERLVGVVPR